MHIIERITNEPRSVRILPIEPDDFKKITLKRYSFNWKKLKNGINIYKLTLIDSEDILGMIAIEDHFSEERTEIKLSAISVENIGKEKQYERIAGCMIGFAGLEAMRKFKNYPALSLVPKTELKQHYISKYGMMDAGWQLYLEDKALLNVIKEYVS